jgi:LPS sulfotransferase NodH
LEETGLEGHFYRVNLSLLKDTVIPYSAFFDAFVRSVNAIQPVSVDVWATEWKKIEQIIASMNLSLPDYESDKIRIEQALIRGEYVGHHSRVFEETYSPHYRIINKDIFEKELRPYLKE